MSSPADFFVRKFNNDSSLTSQHLRKEEKDMEQTLLSSSALKDVRHRFRDFSAICRGEILVGCTTFEFEVCSIISVIPLIVQIVFFVKRMTLEWVFY